MNLSDIMKAATDGKTPKSKYTHAPDLDEQREPDEMFDWIWNNTHKHIDVDKLGKKPKAGSDEEVSKAGGLYYGKQLDKAELVDNPEKPTNKGPKDAKTSWGSHSKVDRDRDGDGDIDKAKGDDDDLDDEEDEEEDPAAAEAEKEAGGPKDDDLDKGQGHEGSCAEAHPRQSHDAWAKSKVDKGCGPDMTKKGFALLAELARQGLPTDLVKAAPKPPKGFTPIPKSTKSGYHKRTGAGWVQWYPDTGITTHAKSDDKGAAEHYKQESEGEGSKEEKRAAEMASLAMAVADPTTRYAPGALGNDGDAARDIARKIMKGVSGGEDVCQVSPPVCDGNLGIPRHDMPQIMDDTLAKLQKKSSWKAQAVLDTGGDPDSQKTMMDTMLDNFRAAGIKVEDGGGDRDKMEDVGVRELKATQSEIKAAKTMFFADRHLQGEWPGGHPCDLSEAPVIISSDNHILDGHHRWAALTSISAERTMKVIRVDLPMKDLLAKTLDMPGVFRATFDDKPVLDTHGKAIGHGQYTAGDADKPDYEAYAAAVSKAVCALPTLMKHNRPVPKRGFNFTWRTFKGL